MKHFLLTITVTLLAGVGSAYADNPPETDPPEVDPCDPLDIGQVAPICDPLYCEEVPGHLTGDPIDEAPDPSPSEVPEERQDAPQAPARIIAPPAQPIASGTEPTYAG